VEETVGTPGAEPCSLLVAARTFGGEPGDLPLLTAGYELVAVLGEDDQFHHLQTLGSMATAAALGWRRGGDAERSTRFVSRVRLDLNGLIEGHRVLERTLQGPASASGGSAQPGAGAHDRVLVFRPDGGVGVLRSTAGTWAQMKVGRLMGALYPDPERG
jgi:hypothetical protein